MSAVSTNEVRLKRVLSDIFGVPSEKIGDEASVDDIETWDSLNHMKLVIALESEFSISFSEEQTVEIINLPLIKAVLSEHGVGF